VENFVIDKRTDGGLARKSFLMLMRLDFGGTTSLALGFVEILDNLLLPDGSLLWSGLNLEGQFLFDLVVKPVDAKDSFQSLPALVGSKHLLRDEPLHRHPSVVQVQKRFADDIVLIAGDKGDKD
jgi:hypothetical protein